MGSREPPKKTASKLSRKRPVALNESAEDFQDNPARRPTKISATVVSDINEELTVTPSITATAENVMLPPCPICGKLFQGCSQQRNSHIKSCGTGRGMTAEQLLKVRRLEEKQAEERRALGLPTFAAPPPQAEAKNASRTKINGKGVQKSSDPHLEMALALSASLAHSEAMKLEEEHDTLRSLGVEILPPPLLALPTSQLPEEAIPQPVVTSYLEKPRKEKRTAKTALEVRTPAEREKQISEKTLAVLSAAATVTCESEVSCILKPAEAPEGRAAESFSSARRKPENPLWTRASTSNGNFVSDSLLGRFLTKESGDQKPHAASERQTAVTAKGESSLADGELQSLADAWEALFESTSQADLTIYTRDDSLKCHSLVLHTRCKQILEDVVVEQEQGKVGTKQTRIVSWDFVSKESAVIFLRYLYCGKLSSVDKQSVYTEVTALARRYVHRSVMAKLLQLDQSLLVPEDEEDEWDELNRVPPASTSAQASLNVSLDKVEHHDSGSTIIGPKSPNQNVCAISADSDEDLFADDPEDADARDDVTDDPADAPAPEDAGPEPNHSQCDDVWEDFNYHDDGGYPLDNSKEADETDIRMSTGATRSTYPLDYPAEDDLGTCGSSSTPLKQKEIANLKAAPDYDRMLSPALRKELRKFGLKAIPRRKAVPLLLHIYQETQKSDPDQETMETSFTSTNSDSETDAPLEESVLLGREYDDDEDDIPTKSQKAVVLGGAALAKRLKEFILGDKELHTKALLYEPIWLEDLFSRFKNEAGVKCKLSEFTDVLDAECITFRTKASTGRRGKGRAKQQASPKKKQKTK